MATASTPGHSPAPAPKKEDQADAQLAVVQAQPPFFRIKKKLSKSAARSLKNGKYFPGQVSDMYQSLVAKVAPTEGAKPLIISYEEKPPKKPKKKKIKYIESNGVKVDRQKYKDKMKDELKNYGITFPGTTE
jgi:hypothetical protein